MNKLWNYIASKNKNTKVIRRIFIFINILIAIVIGYLLWLIIENIIAQFNDRQWLLCFVGYAVIISYIRSVIYIFNND